MQVGRQVGWEQGGMTQQQQKFEESQRNGRHNQTDKHLRKKKKRVGENSFSKSYMKGEKTLKKKRGRNEHFFGPALCFHCFFNSAWLFWTACSG